MERDYHEEPSHSHIRRRRRVGRSFREKTPDAPMHRQRSSEEESSLIEGTTASEDYAPQVVSMQIRPPQRTLSAHESKILRRRDKTFATAAARSHSQPREAERLSEPEATELIRTVKRSLSMPRHKDAESSETENVSRGRTLSPDSVHLMSQPVQATADENLSRLEQNLRRFEEERKRFESEKRLFEREKRDHKVRYKQMMDNEERKRLLLSYRKLSDRIKLPQDAEERRRLVHSLKLDRAEVNLPTVRNTSRRNRHSGTYEESSTQFSSSEGEMVEVSRSRQVTKHMSPSAVKRNNSALASASVRGPPPPPPVRKSLSRNNSLSPVRPGGVGQDSIKQARPASRNNSLSPPRTPNRQSSLSPIRPERRSKTPERQADIIRRMSEREIREKEIEAQQDTTEMESEKETKLRHRRVRRNESQLREEQRRKHSLESDLMQRRKLSLESESKIRRKSSVESVEKLKRKQSLGREDATISHDRVDSGQPLDSNKEPHHKVLMENEKEVDPSPVTESKPSFLRRFFGFFRGSKAKTKAPDKIKEQEELLRSKEEEKAKPEPEPEPEPEMPENASTRVFLKFFFADARKQWRKMKADHTQELVEIRRMRNKCFAHTVALILLIGFGGLMFRYTEGASEDIYKCEVRKVKRDFVDTLWTNSHNMREDDWKTLARSKLRRFEEELHNMGAMGIRYFPGQRSWNFVNSILYCWTVITTIGYGHITPKTKLGQALTISYAIIGIPMFLILLADFGKLFTRCIKFVWGYVRRLYYTGTCRKIRKTQQMRDAMTGVSMVYDVAIRRPSMFFGITTEADIESQISEPGRSGPNSHPETPTSPYPETIVVDDEFNLPISLASVLLISYILVGASVFPMLEDWSYFEAFYFVFISMSTIGFGDLVPNHPIFMMCCIIYFVFGLALTSMFINVVQIKLSDTFKDASAKIGATIGFGVPSDVGDNDSKISDLASIHGSRLDKIAEDENEIVPPPRPLTSILRPARPTSPGSPEDPQGSEAEIAPPPLLPRRQVSLEQPPEEKKKKRRFFK